MDSKKTFDDWLNICKVDIARICKKYSGKINSSYDYDDLFQEASITLWKLFEAGNIKGKNYALTIIERRLIDYIRKVTKRQKYNLKREEDNKEELQQIQEKQMREDLEKQSNMWRDSKELDDWN
jgi:RNA polymerase sigma factor (sigma-70 family)